VPCAIITPITKQSHESISTGEHILYALGGSENSNSDTTTTTNYRYYIHDTQPHTHITHNHTHKTTAPLKVPGKRPLHNRYTRKDTCVRWGMAVTYNRYKFAAVSLLKRLCNGRFTSETRPNVRLAQATGDFRQALPRANRPASPRTNVYCCRGGAGQRPLPWKYPPWKSSRFGFSLGFCRPAQQIAPRKILSMSIR